MVKSGYQDGPNTCESSESRSDENLQCALILSGCIIDNLALVSENAISLATYLLAQSKYLIHFDIINII